MPRAGSGVNTWVYAGLVRIEELARDQLALAAYAGDARAAALLGKRPKKARPWGGDVRGWFKGIRPWGLPAMTRAASATGPIAVAAFAELRKNDRRVARAWRAVAAAMRGRTVDVRSALEPLLAMRAEPWFEKSMRAHCASLTVLRLGQALCAASDKAWVYADLRHLGIASTARAEILTVRALTDGVMACVSATFQARRVREAMERELRSYAVANQ